jgi:tRNA (5-methylaminomethyl-2-thiouridylate)-methyltransferase
VKKKRIAVGLSGGVDSAVSAWLLKRLGYEVVGVFLYCWPPRSEYLNGIGEISEEEKERLRSEWIKKNGCRADEDRSWSLKTALEIEIPWKMLDLSDAYYEKVMKYFYSEYESGRTPNPDVLCNSEIKFGLFLDWALDNGFDAVATGHYARLGCVGCGGSKNKPLNDRVVCHADSFSFVHRSSLVTDSLATPAVASYLDTRLEFSSAKKPSNSSLRSMTVRNELSENNLHKSDNSSLRSVARTSDDRKSCFSLLFSCPSCTSLFLATDNSVVPATTDYLYTRLENSTDYSRNQAFRDCVDSQKKDSARDMKTNDCSVSKINDDLSTSFSPAKKPSNSSLRSMTVRNELPEKNLHESCNSSLCRVARVSNDHKDVYLQIPRDTSKDQTYFLWQVPRSKLSKIVFPLGSLTKTEVRQIAKSANLSVAGKKDSQGICFVGNVNVKEFLARSLAKKIGEVINRGGEVVGEHDGIWFYTIGQRGGWRMSASAQKRYMRNGQTSAWYVIEKLVQGNKLVVAEKSDLAQIEFEVGEVNVLVGDNLWWEGDLRVKIRNLGRLVKCGLKKDSHGFVVKLDEKLEGVAPGQSAVFYSKDEVVVAGGVIT